MRKLYLYLLLIVAAVMTASCERRDLIDDQPNEFELELELEVDIENESVVDLPTVMTAAFYHPTQLHRQTAEYVGPDGGRVNIAPGDYHLLIYNFDTYSTHIREETHYHTAEAYTNNVQHHERADFDALKTMILQGGRGRGYLDEPVIYEPDHLFVTNLENVHIMTYSESGGRQVIHSSVTSVVKAYKILIGPITGQNFISSAVVYLTGQAPSVNLSNRELTGSPSTIYFPIDLDPGQKKFVGTFHTFGKYPTAESHVYLVVDIVDTAGDRYMWEWDVTDQFEDNDNNTIIIQDDIDVPEPEYGSSAGFNPTVNRWEEEFCDIVL